MCGERHWTPPKQNTHFPKKASRGFEPRGPDLESDALPTELSRPLKYASRRSVAVLWPGGAIWCATGSGYPVRLAFGGRAADFTDPSGSLGLPGSPLRVVRTSICTPKPYLACMPYWRRVGVWLVSGLSALLEAAWRLACIWLVYLI